MVPSVDVSVASMLLKYFLRQHRYTQVISINEAMNFEVDMLIICVYVEQHWRQYTSLALFSVQYYE